MKNQLTIEALINEAEKFCVKNSGVYRPSYMVLLTERLLAHLLNIFSKNIWQNDMT